MTSLNGRNTERIGEKDRARRPGGDRAPSEGVVHPPRSYTKRRPAGNDIQPGREVYIKKIDGIVMFIPQDMDTWQPLIENLSDPKARR